VNETGLLFSSLISHRISLSGGQQIACAGHTLTIFLGSPLEKQLSVSLRFSFPLPSHDHVLTEKSSKLKVPSK
jgi:hypothetical protein